ncbi:MAG: protein kinase [Gammaproteobacteria bacterium]|nr:protein kinase [Gammaproteobacteria bacterium]
MAIKIASQSSLADPVSGARQKRLFLNEASLAGKLQHPHIVRVYDAGTSHEMLYIVMEYIAGSTLKRYCHPDALLPLDQVVEIIFKCSNALDYACRQGLIHRDIKPANLLITSGTDVKISDFGSALLVDSELTQVLDSVGTPSYMAPEQIAGREITHQADIYALGVVMYELLTGRLPFQAENQFELLNKVSHNQPLPIEQLRPDIPLPVRQIVYRCMAKQPAERYADWGELSKALAQVHAQLESHSDSESDTRRFNRMKQLHFFRNFSDVELWEVLRISEWRDFSGDRTLLQEGRVGGSLFILASGEVRVIKGETNLGKVTAGHCFGEMAYIQGSRRARSASVVSSGPVSIIKLKSESLTQASERLQSKFNQALLQTLAARLEQTSLLASAL